MGLNLKGLFAAEAEKLVTATGKAIDGIFTNDEERLAKKVEIERVKLELQTELDKHAQEMTKIAADVEKAYLEDVQNARALQVAALAQNDLFSKRFMYYLAAFIILSATAFGVMLFFLPVPEENKRMVEMFADVYLFAGALSVIYFFFGSSKGSHDKSDATNIDQAIKKP